MSERTESAALNGSSWEPMHGGGIARLPANFRRRRVPPGCPSLMGMSVDPGLETGFGDLAARHGRRNNRGTLIILGVPQGDLAEMISGSRPLVGRLLNQMGRRGLIERREGYYWLPGGWGSNGSDRERIFGPAGAERRSIQLGARRYGWRSAIELVAEQAAAAQGLCGVIGN